MKTTPTHRRALAAQIRKRIHTSPAQPANGNTRGGYFHHDTDVCLKLGPASFRIRNHPDTLEAVARRIETGRGLSANDSYTGTPEKPAVLKLDAVRHCGSPEAALATIRRQLATQGESMMPADVRRCERAAAAIEAHIATETLAAEQEAAEDALEARIAAGRQPFKDEILPDGTEVCIVRNHRRYTGTVSSCAVGPHPVLGKQHPVALSTVRADRLKETKRKRYAFHPVRPLTIKKAIWSEITIL